jgi:hypothetical protein
MRTPDGLKERNVDNTIYSIISYKFGECQESGPVELLEINERVKILLKLYVNDLSAAISFRVKCCSYIRFYT